MALPSVGFLTKWKKCSWASRRRSFSGRGGTLGLSQMRSFLSIHLALCIAMAKTRRYQQKLFLLEISAHGRLPPEARTIAESLTPSVPNAGPACKVGVADIHPEATCALELSHCLSKEGCEVTSHTNLGEAPSLGCLHGRGTSPRKGATNGGSLPPIR